MTGNNTGERPAIAIATLLSFTARHLVRMRNATFAHRAPGGKNTQSRRNDEEQEQPEGGVAGGIRSPVVYTGQIGNGACQSRTECSGERLHQSDRGTGGLFFLLIRLLQYASQQMRPAKANTKTGQRQPQNNTAQVEPWWAKHHRY